MGLGGAIPQAPRFDRLVEKPPGNVDLLLDKNIKMTKRLTGTS
jgi:hypothetical protein